ncbi:MAG: DNA mismatch repair endonuclease MutH [Polyangiaceae bacterium]|nr:DNA mismatch repair endonuclease MutH [Polyangiaceae bacterium]
MPSAYRAPSGAANLRVVPSAAGAALASARPRARAGGHAYALRVSAGLPPVSPPESEVELLARARALAGRTLGAVAGEHGVSAPPDLRRAKGFVGTLVERALGATAGSRAEPDFPALGVECKTLPVDARGVPCESTFVCTIALETMAGAEWEGSVVQRKLAKVLWVPVEGDRRLEVARRRLGEPLLWSPSSAEEAELRHDWEELSGLIGRGGVEQVRGELGRALQVRPKAAGSWSRRRALDAEGAFFATLPRGFYLRATFTARVLQAHYHLPGAAGAR